MDKIESDNSDHQRESSMSKKKTNQDFNGQYPNTDTLAKMNEDPEGRNSGEIKDAIERKDQNDNSYDPQQDPLAKMNEDPFENINSPTGEDGQKENKRREVFPETLKGQNEK